MHMPKRAEYAGGNSLLDQLVATASNAILQDAVFMRFETGSMVLDSDERIHYVFFPIDMMISTTTLVQDGSEVEVGSIGFEGMAGIQLVLGIDHVPGKTICQVAGSAIRLPAEHLLRFFEKSSVVRTIMLRYIQATINALEVSIGCNALHGVTARCARWLLITQDRVQRPEFGLTQEFLATMLGARRGTVNAVAQDLQEQGAIRYARGQVQILDRAILKRASCECYQLSADRYDNLLQQVPFYGKGDAPNTLPPAFLA